MKHVHLNLQSYGVERQTTAMIVLKSMGVVSVRILASWETAMGHLTLLFYNVKVHGPTKIAKIHMVIVQFFSWLPTYWHLELGWVVYHGL
jgi:hypothetical protein